MVLRFSIQHMTKLFVFILAILTSPEGLAGPILSGESYAPVLWGPSMVSSQFVQYSVNVSSNGSSADKGFINVVRSDGTWVVQNQLVGFEPGLRTMATDINSVLFISGATYQTTFSTSVQTTAPAFVSGVGRTLSAPVTYLANDPHGAADLGPFSGPPQPPTEPFSFGELKGVTYHTGVPDLAQGLNECYPTSAANSLTWLNNTYNLGFSLTTAQIRDILKDSTHMMTNSASGTFNTNFISGKNLFDKQNNLPIETHQIFGGSGDRPSIANILDEMQDGEDVEITIAPVGKDWGHMVTLVGIADTVSSGVNIAFNDPADGQDQTQTAWVDSEGLIRSGTFAGSEVRYAFSESILPEPSTLTLLCLGSLSLLGYGWRRRRESA